MSKKPDKIHYSIRRCKGEEKGMVRALFWKNGNLEAVGDACLTDAEAYEDLRKQIEQEKP